MDKDTAAVPVISFRGRLRPSQSLVVNLRELARMEATASHLRQEVKGLSEIVSSVAANRDPLPGVAFGTPSNAAKGTAGIKRRPSTTSSGRNEVQVCARY